MYEGLGKKIKAKNFRSASFLRGDVEGERRGPPPPLHDGDKCCSDEEGNPDVA